MANRRALGVEPFDTIVLGMVLSALDDLGVGFDVPYRASPELGDLPKGGLLLVGAHSRMTKLSLRPLLDDGLAPSIVSVYDTLRVPGRAEVVDTLQQSHSMLAEITLKLREGRVVWALADRPGPEPPWTAPVRTALGISHISHPLFSAALLSRASVRFVMTSVNIDGWLVIEFIEPPAQAMISSQAMCDAFAECLQLHVGAISDRDPGVSIPHPFPGTAEGLR